MPGAETALHATDRRCGRLRLRCQPPPLPPKVIHCPPRLRIDTVKPQLVGHSPPPPFLDNKAKKKTCNLPADLHPLGKQQQTLAASHRHLGLPLRRLKRTKASPPDHHAAFFCRHTTAARGLWLHATQRACLPTPSSHPTLLRPGRQPPLLLPSNCPLLACHPPSSVAHQPHTQATPPKGASAPPQKPGGGGAAGCFSRHHRTHAPPPPSWASASRLGPNRTSPSAPSGACRPALPAPSATYPTRSPARSTRSAEGANNQPAVAIQFT